MKEVSVWKTKREVAAKYDALAGAYDTLYGEEQEAKIKSALGSFQLRESDLVLDAGCGTGLLFHHVEKQVGFIVGLDISRKLLERALCRSGSSLKISLIRADADFLPFIDGIFDKVFAVTLLQNMPNVDVTLREVIRTSKKDALLIVTGLKKSYTKEMFLRLVRKAGLEILDVRTDGRLLGFVVVCRKKNRYK